MRIGLRDTLTDHAVTGPNRRVHCVVAKIYTVAFDDFRSAPSVKIAAADGVHSALGLVRSAAESSSR
jgi:hypothetical protein